MFAGNYTGKQLVCRGAGLLLMIIAGIDEAGRGPLAGPVYAACVVLDPQNTPSSLRDSKKLTEQQRESLYDVIIESAVDYAICYATVEEIDTLNILQATFLAMRRSVEKIKVSFDHIMVDGSIYPFAGEWSGEAVVKGDSKISQIMAASILAKVSRDRYMLTMHEQFPQYGFDRHKGYATQEHRDLLDQHGPCSIHRRSFKPVSDYFGMFQWTP